MPASTPLAKARKKSAWACRTASTSPPAWSCSAAKAPIVSRSAWRSPDPKTRTSPGDLEGVVHGLLLGDGARVELPAQRLAFQKLHDGIGDAVLHSEVEDREDVLVGKGRNRQRLALEPRQGIRVRGERLRQHFDRNVALELGLSPGRPRPFHRHRWA